MAKNFQINDQVKIIGNTCGHGIPLGTRGKILNINVNNITNVTLFMLENWTSWWINERDLGPYPEPREDIISEIEQLQEQLVEKQDRLDWMDRTQADSFDEDEFKIYKVLQMMKDLKKNDDAGQLRLAKDIAKLVRKD